MARKRRQKLSFQSSIHNLISSFTCLSNALIPPLQKQHEKKKHRNILNNSSAQLFKPKQKHMFCTHEAQDCIVTNSRHGFSIDEHARSGFVTDCRGIIFQACMNSWKICEAHRAGACRISRWVYPHWLYPIGVKIVAGDHLRASDMFWSFLPPILI